MKKSEKMMWQYSCKMCHFNYKTVHIVMKFVEVVYILA